MKTTYSSNVTFDSSAFSGWVGGSLHNMPASFRGVTQDTRQLEADMLYVALKGDNFDGHDFVGRAFDAGAAAALVEEGYVLPDGLSGSPLIKVEDTRAALLDAAQEWRKLSNARIIGITGSSGKTTTKEMAAALFSGGGKVCCTAGNLNNDIGLPLSLLSMPGDCDFGVFEIGTNHPGEIASLAGVLRPDFGIITNIGAAHIENFGSQEAIAREKGSLADAVTPGGCMILSLETEKYRVLRSLSNMPVFTVSLLHNDADFYGEILDPDQGCVRITERCSRICTEMQSGLPGEHNAVNLLLAYAAARLAGVVPDAAAASLKRFSLPGKRWERIERNGVTIINDAYNANPESVKAVLKVFRDMPCDGRRIAVLGDMMELGDYAPALHQDVGIAAADSGLEQLCLVGEISSLHTAQGALGKGFPAKRLCCYQDAASAGKSLKERLEPGDLILLKASRALRLEEILDVL